MPRLFGYIPSPDDKMGIGPIRNLQLTAGPLPREWHEPLPPALDQQFQDCVANSCAVAICHGQWQADGRPAAWPELPSRAFLYSVSRLRAGISLLDDGGSYIHSLFEAVGQLGFPRESAWTYGEHNLYRAPDWESLRESIDQLYVAGARRIVSGATARRASDVAVAIAGGSVVPWGTQLDQAFADLGPNDVWPGMSGPPIGGHAMVLHAYRTRADGLLEFSSRSSWGEGFADAGSAWVSEAAVTSAAASDFWIVERSPEYSS